MEKIFEHKVAIVTGGSFGIGKATAIALAKRGASVVIADWIQDDSALNEIKDMGGRATLVQCDVFKPSDVAAMVSQAVKVLGKVDFAVNNNHFAHRLPRGTAGIDVEVWITDRWFRW